MEADERFWTNLHDMHAETVMLDVMMPVMDGFTTCSILKSSDDTRFIR
jgi:PleD family two-component response regulator